MTAAFPDDLPFFLLQNMPRMKCLHAMVIAKGLELGKGGDFFASATTIGGWFGHGRSWASKLRKQVGSLDYWETIRRHRSNGGNTSTLCRFSAKILALYRRWCALRAAAFAARSAASPPVSTSGNRVKPAACKAETQMEIPPPVSTVATEGDNPLSAPQCSLNTEGEGRAAPKREPVPAHVKNPEAYLRKIASNRLGSWINRISSMVHFRLPEREVATWELMDRVNTARAASGDDWRGALSAADRREFDYLSRMAQTEPGAEADAMPTAGAAVDALVQGLQP